MALPPGSSVGTISILESLCLVSPENFLVREGTTMSEYVSDLQRYE
jgi:hypothetical protein